MMMAKFIPLPLRKMLSVFQIPTCDCYHPSIGFNRQVIIFPNEMVPGVRPIMTKSLCSGTNAIIREP